MKVVHVIPSLGRGGAEVVMSRILARSKYSAETEVVFFTGEIDVALPPIVGTVCLDLASPNSSLRAARRMRQLFRSDPPDVVIGWLYQGAYATSLATMGTSSAGAWSLHHSPWRRERLAGEVVWRAGALLSRVSAGIVYCAESSRVAHERIGYPRPKGLVITNGVDANAFLPDPLARDQARSDWGLGREVVVFGNVGRLGAAKNQAGLVRAFAGHARRNPTSHLVLVGRGVDEASELAALISGLDLRHRVTLVGQSDHVGKLMNGMDVYVQASLGEAFPVALAEAMAVGLPCVATKVGDSAQLLGGGGWLVDPGSDEDLSRAMDAAVAASQQERRILGEIARSEILTNHTTRQMTEEYDAFVTALLRRRDPRK